MSIISTFRLLMCHKTILFCIIVALPIMLSTPLKSNAQMLTQKLDVQVRADDRSSRELRYQYRVRYRPGIVFSDTWSAHAFVVTGDEYGSSHNTFDDGSADYVYLRRLYGRHTGDYGKTEFGIVPTFKGRVSSSGLSKDGWIKGIRHVRAIGNDNLEVVLGQLKSLDPRDALELPDKLDYVEIEYSARLDEKWSYEFSAERITQANFLRTEGRYKWSEDTTYFAEYISRIDSSKTKVVIGLEGELKVKHYPIEYFAHYSYVSDNFGLRAELTEDFLGFGHGFSSEISGDFSIHKLSWFARYDMVEGRTRVLAGLKWSL